MTDQTKQQTQNEGEPSVAANIFKNRHVKLTTIKKPEDAKEAEASGGTEARKEKKDAAPAPESKQKIPEKKEKTLTLSKEQAEPVKSDKESSEEQKKADVDFKIELEKMQRAMKETQRWGNETKKKLEAYKRAVEKYKEEGILNDDEAGSLLDHTRYEEHETQDKPLIVQYAEIWDRELDNLRKYSSDTDDIDQKVIAFQHMLQNSTAAEIEEVLGDLKDLIGKDDVAFTRKMLDYGKQYFDEVYSDIHEAGNLKNLKKRHDEKIAEYEKKIVTLNKEIAKLKEKYEDDTAPTYRIPDTGNQSKRKNPSSGDAADIFKNRHAAYKSY
jgi:hypothetical protein